MTKRFVKHLGVAENLGRFPWNPSRMKIQVNSLEVLPLEGESFGDFCTEELPWVCHERPPVMGDIFFASKSKILVGNLMETLGNHR